MQDERRRTPRYPFIATAEISRKGMASGISAQLSELSLYGCFIQMPDPFEKGTEIFLKAYANGKFFEAAGTVAYALPGQGAGISFQNVSPHYLPVLKKWLIEAARSRFAKSD
ncbi:MAG TPA: PilZ domain-containing protein [Candidatus Acidoferrum sp.]|nr:PilZ domain-containing protein [Candidatus Acidoferrum sp.]